VSEIFTELNYVKYIGGVPLLLRNRLKCRLEKTMETSDKSEEMNNSFNANILFNSSRFNDSSYVNHDDSYFDGNEEWLSLNEVVVSRGPSPFLSNLDLYVNDYLITTVQGDGLIISTPTGNKDTFIF
jgi:NAD kinase